MPRPDPVRDRSRDPGTRRGRLTDRATQRWVRATGRRVLLAEHPWLAGPVGAPDGIGAEFHERLAAASGLEIADGPGPRGLLPDFSALTGPRFAAAAIHPEIARFYEQTSAYAMDVWSAWSGAFRPFGGLLTRLFSRRLQQLNMPLSPPDTSRGVASQIVHLVEPASRRLAHVGWVRQFAHDRRVIYVGDYSSCAVPGFAGPCVRVVFPLPNGSATVILWPEARPDGSLVLHSSGRRFGDPGFYFVVARGQSAAWARYVPSMTESIHVYAVDRAGRELRTDHEFRLFGATYLRLHYRLTRSDEV